MRLYKVTDETGSFPMLWDEPEPPRSSARVSWCFVAEVDSVEEADAVIDSLGLDSFRRNAFTAGRSGRTEGR